MRNSLWAVESQNDEPAWGLLRRQFVAWSDGAESLQAAWRVLVAHPWYRRELRLTACRVARRVGLPASAAADLEQEAVLLLARQLRRTPMLKFDPRRPEAAFPAWLGRIIERHCREAARATRRCRRGEVALTFEPVCLAEPGPPPPGPWELSAAIAELPGPDRRVIESARHGRTLRETADRTGLSYGQTKRAYHRGIAALRQRLTERAD